MINTASNVEFKTAIGRLAGLRYGPMSGRLIIIAPGLSQDARSLDSLASRLASEERQVLAISPRGRGASEATGPGTYGWENHAADIAEIATQLGQSTFDLIGWSFGGLVALKATSLFGSRIRKLVLIDVVGKPDPSSLVVIAKGLERLGTVFPSRHAYVDLVLSSGAMTGFEEVWRPYLEGDLVPCEGGLTTRTNKDAVVEDALYGSQQDVYALWPSVRMPALLVRAAREILPGAGYIVSEEDSHRFPATVKSARVVTVDANHYCVGYHPDAVAAMNKFLRD